MKKKPTQQEIDLYIAMQDDPTFFVKVMWGLTPQHIKEEYEEEVAGYVKNYQLNKIKFKHFENINGHELYDRHYYTWQEWVVLLAVRAAIEKKKGNKITVKAGHGVGKDTLISWLSLWFLYCHYQALVSITAPLEGMLQDVLRLEIKKWISLMPIDISKKFVIQKQYIRINEKPECWFIRLNSHKEAMGGCVGDNILRIVNEASNVRKISFDIMEGNLVKDDMVIMFSNPMLNKGYFYNSFHKDKRHWQKFTFSSAESLLVDDSYPKRIIKLHGKNSDMHKIRVLGKFTNEK